MIYLECLGYFNQYISDTVIAGVVVSGRIVPIKFAEAWRRLRGLPKFSLLWESLPYDDRLAWLKSQIAIAMERAEFIVRIEREKIRAAIIDAESMALMI